MKRVLVLFCLMAALPFFAATGAPEKILISPGVTFTGFSHPWLTIEATAYDFQSVKLWFSEAGIIVGFRLWPQEAQGWPYNDTLPVFAGFGMAADWQNSVTITGFFAEVGLKIWDTIELGFSLRQFGASGVISVNLGLSFTLAIPAGD